MSGERPRAGGEAGARDAAAETAESQLIAHLARERDERREQVLAQARAEAARLLAEARRKARQRVREAARTERARAERELRAVRARVDTGLRQARHAATQEVLDSLWARLDAALAARWHDPPARAAWIESALARAGERLPPGTWTLACPSGSEADDEVVRRAVPRLAGREDVDIELRGDPEVAVGVRVHCANAVLDATDRGLLCKPGPVRARLLARLARRQGLAAAGIGEEDGNGGDG